MRRSTLMLLVVLFASFTASVSFAADTKMQWSSGVTLMESSGQTEIGTRLEVTNNGELIACWFSKSGVLPIVFDGLALTAYGDFGGIEKIESVVLSPDGGKTQWPAQFNEGLGWMVQLPRFEVGSWSLEWGVRSKDRHNRVTLIIIPINWSSHRTTQTSNYLMVQTAPLGWEQMPKEMAFAYLRGFVSSWATPDPAVIAAQAMMAGGGAQAGSRPGTPTLPTKPAARYEKIVLKLVYRGELIEIPVTVDINTLKKDLPIYFMRDGHQVATAKIDNDSPYRTIDATVTSGNLAGGEKVWM